MSSAAPSGGSALPECPDQGARNGWIPWLGISGSLRSEQPDDFGWNQHLELIDTLSPQIRTLDGRIRRTATEHPTACLLQTVPGIGAFRSLVLVGEIAPISRFPSSDHLVSYAGLAPITRSSGGKTRQGSLPQKANRWVRGALVAAIPAHMRATPDSSLGIYYDRLKERMAWQKARVATARKLCRVIYAMLSTGEVWRG